jgi:hypothetical protein
VASEERCFSARLWCLTRSSRHRKNTCLHKAHGRDLGFSADPCEKMSLGRFETHEATENIEEFE